MVYSLVAQMVKHLPAMLETQVQSLGQEDPLEKEMPTHSSTLAWRTHGGRSLVGYSPWGCKELDTTEQLNNKNGWISDGKASAYNAGDLGLIPVWGRAPGEGNGTPLQYSCLENPMEGGAW